MTPAAKQQQGNFLDRAMEILAELNSAPMRPAPAVLEDDQKRQPLTAAAD